VIQHGKVFGVWRGQSSINRLRTGSNDGISDPGPVTFAEAEVGGVPHITYH